ncbi:hypothetical protein EDD22DRAFT_789962 [Suillus occidentalis]|nr:hypothetical protein EDD22DRAFT_789962 [Suillus occidentalis]
MQRVWREDVFLVCTDHGPGITQCLCSRRVPQTLPRSCARWRAYNRNVVVSVPLASAGSPADVVFVDLQGHAYLAYVVEAGQTKVFVIRPDGVIEAIIHDAESVKMYFSRIFLDV